MTLEQIQKLQKTLDKAKQGLSHAELYIIQTNNPNNLSLEQIEVSICEVCKTLPNNKRDNKSIFDAITKQTREGNMSKEEKKEITLITEEYTHFSIPKDIDLESCYHWYADYEKLFIKVNEEDKEYLEFEYILSSADSLDLSCVHKVEDENNKVLWIF